MGEYGPDPAPLSDRAAMIVLVFTLLLASVAIVGGVYLHFFAPCDQVDWMPTKDVPARCLNR